MDHPFRFDANSGRGLMQWPVPPVSAEAAVLLSALLNHAVSRTPRLTEREFTIHVHGENLARIKALTDELLLVKFPMPAEGVDHPVPALETATCYCGVLRYRIGELYGAHLMALGLTQAPAVDPSVEARPPEFDADEVDTMVAALRVLVSVRAAGARHHAIESALAGRYPLSEDAFGVSKAVKLLAKFGAKPGGASFC